MKKIILSWFLPFAIAIVLVIIARIWMFSSYVVKNYSMAPNLVEGDVALCINGIPKKRNKIVLYSHSKDDFLMLKRQVAIPGDTLAIKEGKIVVNGQKINGNINAINQFFFYSDSVKKACKFLNNNDIVADFRKAYLGFFECKLSDENVSKIKQLFTHSTIKRKSIEPKVRPLGELFGHLFYWNYDNMGSLLVPKKGMKIWLGKRSFYLYKEIIEQETNKKPEIREQGIYIGETKQDIYTFKKDYVFLVNDNRSNHNDSRATGFVAKDRLKGTYLFKLPW